MLQVQWLHVSVALEGARSVKVGLMMVARATETCSHWNCST